jgi:hypothetical protein
MEMEYRVSMVPMFRVVLCGVTFYALLRHYILGAGGVSLRDATVASLLVVVSSWVVTAAGLCRSRIVVSPISIAYVNGFYRSVEVSWSSITRTIPRKLLGMRFLLVYSGGSSRPLWLPLDVVDYGAFRNGVSSIGPKSNPLML